ncbi:hypothetical protein QCA50_015037 [Cerrena zonata]|uniref:Uncharacterized protein n=1 Tax=Cerrena zonata TaxID=2478898 RepID=A0AAW0FJS9_9APHY
MAAKIHPTSRIQCLTPNIYVHLLACLADTAGLSGTPDQPLDIALVQTVTCSELYCGNDSLLVAVPVASIFGNRCPSYFECSALFFIRSVDHLYLSLAQYRKHKGYYSGNALY